MIFSFLKNNFKGAVNLQPLKQFRGDRKKSSEWINLTKNFNFKDFSKIFTFLMVNLISFSIKIVYTSCFWWSGVFLHSLTVLYYTLRKPLPIISLLVVTIINADGSSSLIAALNLMASILLQTVCIIVFCSPVYSPTTVLDVTP